MLSDVSCCSLCIRFVRDLLVTITASVVDLSKRADFQTFAQQADVIFQVGAPSLASPCNKDLVSYLILFRETQSYGSE
jgi:hypothetical protein